MCVHPGGGVFEEMWFEVRWDYPSGRYLCLQRGHDFQKIHLIAKVEAPVNTIFWGLETHISFYRQSLQTGRSPVPIIHTCLWGPWDLGDFGRHRWDSRMSRAWIQEGQEEDCKYHDIRQFGQLLGKHRTTEQCSRGCGGRGFCHVSMVFKMLFSSQEKLYRCWLIGFSSSVASYYI